ncbi:MAG: phosphoenolpyruvate kinase [Acidobacteria bacterium]|nr:phosphoenolpyruvate kinase [Acidobacteriota bacterium]
MARKSKPVQGSLTSRDLRPLLQTLKRTNLAIARAYPGEPEDRQPVHTVYGGAHLFRSDSASKLGTLALAALNEYAPDARTLDTALRFDPSGVDSATFAETIRNRVVEKLRREPVEDFRIDFEDGYGNRPDAEEDAHAQSAAEEVAVGAAAGALPPFIGIRIKTLSTELHRRSLRTLDLFVTTLARANRKRLPANFVVTVPKIMLPGQVRAVARACTVLEKRIGLESGAIRLELMIETPQSILAPDGSSALRGLVVAGQGRVSGAHFGTYDYTALCGITAAWQHMRHDACDFAKHMMQIALAQSGVKLSDGATNIMPVAPHRAEPGRALSDSQKRENRDAVHRAWKIHFDDARHSLVNGFYQGWDLHPAQLPTRYAAVYGFFLSALPAATARLRNFVNKAAQATLVGDVFDDAATGQGLLNFFARGLSSGALTMDEARETGLTPDELHGRSFLEILRNRNQS